MIVIKIYNWIKEKMIAFLIAIGFLGVAFAGTIIEFSPPPTIESMLVDKTVKQKANIKGQEIAKIDFRGEYVNQIYGVRIEIIQIKTIEGGVSILARAWRGGKQLGFGKDGSVDIERFNFINPPVLVDDNNGSIVREWIDNITGELKQRKLREDPAEAIRESLAHTISISPAGKIDTNIVRGKIGSTHEIFFSSTSGDGRVGRGNQTSWANARDTADGNQFDTTSVTVFLRSEEEFAGEFAVDRGFFPFDTSSLPDGDTIDSATFSVFVTSNDDGTGRGLIYGLIETSQVSTSALENGDFDALTVNSPSEGATRVGLTTTSAFSDFTLNSTGLGFIDATGFTKLGLRGKDDIDDFDPPAGRQFVFVSSSDETGTSQDPKLVVVHSAAAATFDDTYFESIDQ